MSHSILFSDPIPLENVHISIVDEWFSHAPEIQAQVDAMWAEKVAESERQGSTLWDGNNYRLCGYSVAEGRLSLEIGYAKYRNIATRLFSPTLRDQVIALPYDASPNGLYVAGFIESNDGYFVFGERSGRYLRTA